MVYGKSQPEASHTRKVTNRLNTYIYTCVIRVYVYKTKPAAGCTWKRISSLICVYRGSIEMLLQLPPLALFALLLANTGDCDWSMTYNIKVLWE